MSWINRIRAKVKGAPKEYRSIALAHGTSRKKALSWIAQLGGYSDRGGRYPISFNVKAYYADFSAERVFSKMKEDGSFSHLYDMCRNPGELGVLYGYVAQELRGYESSSLLFNGAVETAARPYTGEDDLGSVWGDDESEAEFLFLGRSGGHLVLKYAFGIGMSGHSEEELEELLLERETGCGGNGNAPGEYCVADSKVMGLFLLCVQLSVECTPRKASDEVEYQAAWAVMSGMDAEELRSRLSAYRDVISGSARAGTMDAPYYESLLGVSV